MQPGITLLKAGNDPRDAALFETVLQNGQRGGAIQYGRKVNSRVGTRQSHTQAERLGKTFVQGEIGHHKCLWR